MAEGDGYLYGQFVLNLLKGRIDLTNKPVKIALTTGYSDNLDTDATWLEVSVYEYAAGGNYTAGGKEVTGKQWTYDSDLDTAYFDGGDITWNNLGPLTPATPDHAVMYLDDSTYVGSPLIAMWVLGTTPTNGGMFKLEWDTKILGLTK